MTPHTKVLLQDAARAALSVFCMALVAMALICLLLAIACSA